MPRWASRITLNIDSVGIERIQDISSVDCIAEGITPIDDVRRDFKLLWDRINKSRGFGWESNPCVWVVKFSVLEGES